MDEKRLADALRALATAIDHIAQGGFVTNPLELGARNSETDRLSKDVVCVDSPAFQGTRRLVGRAPRQFAHFRPFFGVYWRLGCLLIALLEARAPVMPGQTRNYLRRWATASVYCVSSHHMTAQQIADAYRLGAQDPRPIRQESDRIGKAKLMAQRFKVDWTQVELLLKQEPA